MDRKLIGTLLLILASCGCCACSNSCDYLPPVLDGPYSPQSMRSGSAMAGSFEEPIPIESESITPLPVAAPE